MSNLVLGEQLARFAVDRGGGLEAAIVLADPDGADELTTVRWGALDIASDVDGNGSLPAAKLHADQVAQTPAGRGALMLSAVMPTVWGSWIVDGDADKARPSASPKLLAGRVSRARQTR